MSHVEQKDGFGSGCRPTPQAQGARFAGKPQLSQQIRAALAQHKRAWLEGPAQLRPGAGSSLLLVRGGVILVGPMASSPPAVYQAG